MNNRTLCGGVVMGWGEGSFSRPIPSATNGSRRERHPPTPRAETMQFYEHLIQNRASQCFPVSQEQQNLFAHEIKQAAQTIREWQTGTPPDREAHEQDLQEECRLTEAVFKVSPITLAYVWHAEMSEGPTVEDFEEAWKELGNPTEAILLMIGIDLFLAVRGTDAFVGEHTGEKPSDWVLDTIKGGGGSLHFIAKIRTPKAAMREHRRSMEY